MGRKSVLALAASAVLALAACGDSPEPLATEGGLAPVRPGTGCNTSDAKSKARSHFGQPTQNEVVGMIDLLIASLTPADSTKNGFDVLERVELGQDVVGTPQTALDLVNAILPCIEVGATSIGPVGIFETDGAFAIRGGAGDARPVYSGDEFSAVAPPDSPPEFDTWSEWLGLPDGNFPDPRAIIYGTPFNVGNISNESEVGARGFDWNTLPGRSFPRPADGFLGLCVGNNLSDRIQNNHATQQGVQQGVLGFYDPSDPPLSLGCTGFDQNGNPVGSASLLRRALDLLGPQPLFAAVKLGGTGGTPGGYSNHFVVLVEQAAILITVQPSSEKIGDPISPPVKVLAKTAAGTPIQRIDITAAARSNLGVPANLSGDLTQKTDEFGVATFDDLVINSSGTYRLTFTATGGTENLNVTPATSDQFFIGNRSKK